MEPVSRIEKYLDRMANGGSGDLPVPVSRIEHYLAQIAEGGGGGGGGGGSGLPSVTPDDFGKSLQVVRGTPSYTQIAPSQTVVFDGSDGEALSNADVTLFTAGIAIRVVINDSEYSATTFENQGVVGTSFYDSEDNEYSLWVYNNTLYFSAYDGTYTVSVSKITYPSEWAVVSPLCIKLTGIYPNSITGGEVFAGSAFDAFSNIAKGIPVPIYVLVGTGLIKPSFFEVYIESDQLVLHIRDVDQSQTASFVASSSGGSATTRVYLPVIHDYYIYVTADGTVTGWWNE